MHSLYLDKGKVGRKAQVMLMQYSKHEIIEQLNCFNPL